jgi:hypothetical protein
MVFPSACTPVCMRYSQVARTNFGVDPLLRAVEYCREPEVCCEELSADIVGV